MAWVRYKNLSGNSSVRYYDISTYRILLYFKGGQYYKYKGVSTLSILKSLAIAGKGLNSYINKYKPVCEQLSI